MYIFWYLPRSKEARQSEKTDSRETRDYAARIRAVFDEIDRLGGGDFLPEGRPEQPPMPPARVFDHDFP